MKKIVKVLTILLLGLSLKNVNADSLCETSELKRLKELANNVQFKTKYEVVSTDEEYKEIIVKYDIEIVNFDEDLRIEYKSQYDDDSVSIKSDTTNISGINPGKITFKIYAWTTNLCVDEYLRTVTINLENLNSYYYFNKEKCDQNPDFKYCKEFLDTTGADFDEIDKEFEEYLNPSAKDVVDKVIKGNIPWYFYVGGGVLVVGIIGTVIFIVTKKRKKDDL